jgi:hypothetical protein
MTLISTLCGRNVKLLTVKLRGGSDVLIAMAMKSVIFCDINQAACFMLVSCLAYSSILKMEAIRSSETSIDFHRTTRHYIREDRTLKLCGMHRHLKD